MGKVPDAVGAPLRSPVDELNVTPLGSAPDSESVGAGKPVAVTGSEPIVPATNVALLGLVIAGGAFTVNVKLCVASVPRPL